MAGVPVLVIDCLAFGVDGGGHAPQAVVVAGLGQQHPRFLVIAFGLEKFIGCVIGAAGGVLAFHGGIVPLRQGQGGCLSFSR